MTDEYMKCKCGHEWFIKIKMEKTIKILRTGWVNDAEREIIDISYFCEKCQQRLP